MNFATEMVSLFVDIFEIGEGLGGVSVHGLGSGLPVGRADLAVLLDELEGLDKPDDFVYVAADGKVVHGDLAKHSSGTDNVKPSEGNA